MSSKAHDKKPERLARRVSAPHLGCRDRRSAPRRGRTPPCQGHHRPPPWAVRLLQATGTQRGEVKVLQTPRRRHGDGPLLLMRRGASKRCWSQPITSAAWSRTEISAKVLRERRLVGPGSPDDRHARDDARYPKARPCRRTGQLRTCAGFAAWQSIRGRGTSAWAWVAGRIGSTAGVLWIGLAPNRLHRLRLGMRLSEFGALTGSFVQGIWDAGWAMASGINSRSSPIVVRASR